MILKLPHGLNKDGWIHLTCQGQSRIIFVSLTRHGKSEEVHGGRLFGHQGTAGGVGFWAKGFGGRRRCHRVLRFPAADSEEVAPRTRANRHLREDGQVSQAVKRQASEAR